MNTERRYDIDWIRVLAIALLIIYHIAIIFQPWALFIGFIKSDTPLEGLWKPMTLLNVWRIPLLFYVSGMGLYFALRKRNWKQLLRERATRILLPFLFGVFAITPLHMYIFQDYYQLAPGYYWHLGHLWFLGNIFVYVVLLLPVFIYLKKHENGRFHHYLSRWMQHPLGPLALTLFFILEVQWVQPQLFALYAKTWHGFFLGLLAFFSGFLLVYSGHTFWQTIRQWKWAYLGLAAVLFGIRTVAFASEAPGYLMALESNSWIFALFGMGYSYLNTGSRTLRYLSTAAYPVYILHMVVLYAGAWLILPLAIPTWVQFVAITAFTFAGCYALYEIIKRIPVLRPLFGLKWKLPADTKVAAKGLETQEVRTVE